MYLLSRNIINLRLIYFLFFLGFMYESKKNISHVNCFKFLLVFSSWITDKLISSLMQNFVQLSFYGVCFCVQCFKEKLSHWPRYSASSKWLTMARALRSWVRQYRPGSWLIDTFSNSIFIEYVLNNARYCL